MQYPPWPVLSIPHSATDTNPTSTRLQRQSSATKPECLAASKHTENISMETPVTGGYLNQGFKNSKRVIFFCTLCILN